MLGRVDSQLGQFASMGYKSLLAVGRIVGNLELHCYIAISGGSENLNLRKLHWVSFKSQSLGI